MSVTVLELGGAFLGHSVYCFDVSVSVIFVNVQS